MLLTLTSLRERDKDGFTLIELLVVIVIIGVLAAIALPIFIDQQKAAVDASVKSDVRNTVENVQNWRVDHRTTVASNANDYKAAGGVVAKSRDNSVIGVSADADGSYTVCAYNSGSKNYTKAEDAWAFDSATGKFSLTATSTCAGAVNDAGDDLSYTATAPKLTKTSLAAATQDTQYSDTLTGSGKPAPTFEVPASGAGALPSGLSLNSVTGVISGTPTASGTFTVAVTAKNRAGSDTQNLSLKITSKDAAPSAFSSAATAATGTCGVSYPGFTVAADGYPAATYSAPTLTGQTGLSLNTTTGKISGTVSGAASGAISVAVTATNRVGSISQNLTIPVNCATQITATSLPNATQYTKYTDTTLATSGYPAANAFTATGLPTGLSINPTTGVISGTPADSAATKSYSVTFTASNGLGQASSKVIPLVLQAFVPITIFDSQAGGQQQADYTNVTPQASMSVLSTYVKFDDPYDSTVNAYRTLSGLQVGHTYKVSTSSFLGDSRFSSSNCTYAYAGYSLPTTSVPTSSLGNNAGANAANITFTATQATYRIYLGGGTSSGLYSVRCGVYLKVQQTS